MKIKTFNPKVITSTLLSGVVALTLSGCITKSNYEFEDTSINSILQEESIKDITLLDELDKSDEESIVDRANKLESYIYLQERITLLPLAGIDSEEIIPLTEYEMLTLNTISKEEIQELIDNVSKPIDESSNMYYVDIQNKLLAAKKLNYITKDSEKWLEDNAYQTSIDIMIDSVKASLAQELDLSVEDYSKIKINIKPSTTPDVKEVTYTISVDDKEYIVSPSQKEIWNTMNKIYDMQNTEPTSTTFNDYKEALDLSKITITSGCSIKDGSLVETKNSISYTKKIL